jgi:hypothetical protein|tara:strand:+ start:779 stop:931 length:153 start_codon:yes stop_codon:yes gene_type:complete
MLRRQRCQHRSLPSLLLLLHLLSHMLAAQTAAHLASVSHYEGVHISLLDW